MEGKETKSSENNNMLDNVIKSTDVSDDWYHVD